MEKVVSGIRVIFTKRCSVIVISLGTGTEISVSLTGHSKFQYNMALTGEFSFFHRYVNNL